MTLPYIDSASRARLNDCRGRLTDLRRQQSRLRDQIGDARNAVDVSGTAEDVQRTPGFQRLEQLQRDATNLALQVSSVAEEETYLLSRMAGVEGTGQRESFLSDPTTLEELRLMSSSTEPIGRKILGEAISRDQLLAHFEQRRQAAGIVSDSFGGTFMASAGDALLPSDASRTRFAGVVPQLRRRVSVLDLINTGTMDVGSFDYLVESGSLESGPAETAELTLKPSDNLGLTDATAKAQTIAVWARMSKPQLADVPALQTVVQTRLTYKVLRRLENQIISGDGTGQNILGITHSSGIGAPASVVGDANNTDLVLNALGSVLTSEAEPNGAVLHPLDAIKMFKTKATSGVRLDSNGAFSDLPATIWGLPLILSTALPSGHALVGDWTLGATLLMRQGMTVLISDSDQDDWVRNALKILAELRAALMVDQPAAFAYVPLSFAT